MKPMQLPDTATLFDTTNAGQMSDLKRNHPYGYLIGSAKIKSTQDETRHLAKEQRLKFIREMKQATTNLQNT